MLSPPTLRSLYIYLFTCRYPSLVTVLPHHDPIITGLSNSYEDGQYLDINCTSDLSYPAPELVWFINDKEVSGAA